MSEPSSSHDVSDPDAVINRAMREGKAVRIRRNKVRAVRLASDEGLSIIGTNDLAGCHLVFAATPHAVVGAHIFPDHPECQYDQIRLVLNDFKHVCNAIRERGDKKDLPKELTCVYIVYGYVDKRIDPDLNRNMRPQRDLIWNTVRNMKLSEDEPLSVRDPMYFQYWWNKVHLQHNLKDHERARKIMTRPGDGTAFVRINGKDEPELFVEDEKVAQGLIRYND